MGSKEQLVSISAKMTKNYSLSGMLPWARPWWDRDSSGNITFLLAGPEDQRHFPVSRNLEDLPTLVRQRRGFLPLAPLASCLYSWAQDRSLPSDSAATFEASFK